MARRARSSTREPGTRAGGLAAHRAGARDRRARHRAASRLVASLALLVFVAGPPARVEALARPRLALGASRVRRRARRRTAPPSRALVVSIAVFAAVPSSRAAAPGPPRARPAQRPHPRRRLAPRRPARSPRRAPPRAPRRGGHALRPRVRLAARARSRRGSRCSRGVTPTTTASARCSRAGRSARRTSTPSPSASRARATRPPSSATSPATSSTASTSAWSASTRPRSTSGSSSASARSSAQTPLLPFLHSRAGRAVFPVLREMNDAADPGDARARRRRAIALGERGKPFFLTVFFSTAHFPYAAPAPYYGRFTRRGYRGRFKYDKPVGLEQRGAARRGGHRRRSAALYDGAVAEHRRRVADVLRRARRHGARARTRSSSSWPTTARRSTRTATARGTATTSSATRGRTCRCIVYDPRRAGRGGASPGIVRDVDLAPTLYELAGVAPPPDLDGASLAPALAGATLRRASLTPRRGSGSPRTMTACAPELRLPYPGLSQAQRGRPRPRRRGRPAARDVRR